MLPMMCDQLPCMNMAVRIVIQRCPATISAGISDHRVTNSSPPNNSRIKTSPLIAMMAAVTMGKRVGRREASPSGINDMASPQVLREVPGHKPRCLDASKDNFCSLAKLVRARHWPRSEPPQFESSEIPHVDVSYNIKRVW